MKRLLIIDPDERVRESLRAIFEPNYALAIASTPEEGQTLLKEPIDLLILDLPPSGEAPPADLLDCGIPILGLASSPSPIDGIDLIAKPFDVREIRTQVAQAIQANPRKPSHKLPIPETSINLEQAVNDFERSLIVQALENCGGVQTRAAGQLGTTRRILRYRMGKLGIAPPARKQSQPNPCQSPHPE